MASLPTAQRGKRILDLGFSLAGLILLSPLFLFLSVAVKSDSTGPVFFRQTRIGRRGIPFRIWKFRTMEAGASDGAQITVAGDPRITRVGRWLRDTKLDELPQLLNVALGQMSLVGPRPEVPQYVALYPDGVRETVLSVRPGITDAAAIEFSDESALLAQSEHPERLYIDQVLPRKLELYVQYVEHWSLGRDLRLIIQTFKALLLPTGPRR